MSVPPEYFEAIRQKAVQRWEQLEQDVELAAPWYQLFKQVQSPRHVLSELLQNADDAGATEAVVRIEDHAFIFEHDGEDFKCDHFASLCRFGYSNKRALHTIGFRGIGFKSTFSLGACVELYTPTLSVSFDRKRFTEPRWQVAHPDTNGKTCVRVAISDQHREREVEKNLAEWLKSPLSLLFFKNIRRLQIGTSKVHWRSLRPGPVPNSEWMTLNEQADDVYLLLQSEAEPFPDEALNEIKQERMLGIGEDIEFPPSTIEIVLGAKGQLFVVLPTGVETKLPFACNAPFIQDPARLKIKDPETSPTNRWLLERAGQLAASAMLTWISQSDMPVQARASAYGLVPDVDRKDSTLEGNCGTMVEMAFEAAIANQPLLLTNNGDLTVEKASIILPKALFDVWPPEQAAALLDEKGRPPLCQHVELADQRKLLRWELVEQIDKPMVIRTLQSKHLPKPDTWLQLMHLWAYITPDIISYRLSVRPDRLCIVPVQGKDILYAATDVVRLGDKKLLQSEDDWEFLATYLIVLNQNWPRFLAEQRHNALEQKDELTQKAVNAAYSVLEQIRLNDASDANKIIGGVATKFFFQESVKLPNCVRLTQIAAKLGATVGNSFRYVTRDMRLRPTSQNILFDKDGTLEVLIPEQLQPAQILHPGYTAAFSACSREEWLRWISSGRAGIHTFIPLVQKRIRVSGRSRIQQEAAKRGLKGALFYPYESNGFAIEDWDFDQIYWEHWQALTVDDERIWAKVVARILSQRSEYWSQAKSAGLIQIATNGRERSITDLLPSWVLNLRNVPCLLDTRGFPQKPGDLLRRTPATESLIDVEPFVDAQFDTEATRPLLDLLGVQSTPTGPDRLLDRLRALAKAEKPPIHEVEKWYRRLDQLITTCSTADFLKIKQAFHLERLVLTQDGTWAVASAVFLSTDEEDVPGVAVIRSSVHDLILWRKIDIAERPTAELAIQWLQHLPSGGMLSSEDARRVRALIARYPDPIWTKCEHWLNLAREWVPVKGLHYALTMQSLVSWRHLHQWIKQKTADLQGLPRDVTSDLPFSALPPLVQHLEERLHQDPRVVGQQEKREWLTTIGNELRRVELATEGDTQHIRAVAERLARTEWHTTQILEVMPYLEGTPAGTSRQTDILWFGTVLYVAQLPKAKLAKRVPEEIGNAFGRDDIKAALDYSFERAPEDIREYLEVNFKLVPVDSILELTGDGIGASSVEESIPQSPPTDADTLDRSAITEQVDNEVHNDIPMDASDESAIEQQDDSEQGSAHNREHLVVRMRPTPKPSMPGIIERFAKTQGFRKDQGNRFFHEDGSWIGRTSGSAFPWERRDRTGGLVRYYWPKDHCLDVAPLQLDADVWEMLERHPETYALILVDTAEEPVEVTGTHLRAMRDDEKITLYPASYRLVYVSDNHA